MTFHTRSKVSSTYYFTLFFLSLANMPSLFLYLFLSPSLFLFECTTYNVHCTLYNVHCIFSLSNCPLFYVVKYCTRWRLGKGPWPPIACPRSMCSSLVCLSVSMSVCYLICLCLFNLYIHYLPLNIQVLNQLMLILWLGWSVSM